MKMLKCNYYLCFPVILLVSQWGAKFPDLDHDFSHIKDRNVLTWIINKIIHITGGKHRSWQTHSWDICIAYSIISNLLIGRYLKDIDASLAFLINCGFLSGWVSHMFSDMLNGVGVRIVCWNSKTIAFVPKQFLGFHFNTGGDWEMFNYKVMRIADVVLGVIALIYPFMTNVQTVITG
jgi:hypothetical protein